MRPGYLVADRYRLLSQIGGGGMGTVWLARDERLGREVAVKQVLLPAGLDPQLATDQRERAMREGRIAARLSHPHAISVYDVAVDSGVPWLVMEYLPSRSLATVLDDDGVLPAAQVAQIGAQVADALAATHAAGIVHRDVKPANVLIGQGGRVQGLVKITDFGISHAHGDVTLTQTGAITGTPAFLAPEVARGQPPDNASDVFSLGATLFTCLEGQPPFGMGDNALQMLHRVAGGQMDPPRLAGQMTEPLLRMLAAEAGDRPSMAQVRDELAALAAGRDGDTISVLTAPLGPAGGAVVTATRTDLAAPAPARPAAARPVAARPVAARQRGMRWPRMAAGLLALLLAALAIVWVSTRGDEPTTSAQPTSAPTSAPESEPESEPTQPSTTSTPAASSSAQDPVAAVEQTLQNYYALLPGDTEAAYAQTGPSLRSVASFDYYQDFFGPYSEVNLVSVRDVQQGDGVITATTEVEFIETGGGRQVEQHAVRFIPSDDGGLLIDLDEFVAIVG